MASRTKAYSITARLTVTFAVLTAAVLAPAAVGIYFVVAGFYSVESMEKATDRARWVADSLLRQLDKDFLVEFDGQPLEIPGLATGAEDWAVIRAGGEREHAAGAFAAGLTPELGSPETIVEGPDGRPLRVASVILVRDTGLALDELAPQVREVLEKTCPEAAFLSARRDVSKGVTVIQLRKLGPDRIFEIKVSGEGELLKAHEEELPQELDPAFLQYVSESDRPQADLCVSWQPCAGQLIAVIQGTSATGEATRCAMNRLGERFLLDPSGRVIGPDPESRLVVVAAVDVSQEIARRRTFLLGVLLSAPAVWLGLVLIGWFVARRAMSPVGKIVESTRSVRLSDLSGRVPVGAGDDELTRIAHTINDMLDRLESGYQRERRFTGDASHELRGPLTKIQADAELALARDRTLEEYRDALGRIGGYARRMKRLVESLLLLARLDGRQEDLKKEPFDLTQLVVETVNTFPEEDIQRVQIQVGESKAPISVLGERSLIGTAIHNVVENAFRYSPQGSPVVVRLSPNGTRVFVEVEDHGAGLSGEDRDRVFDRFYRVDASRGSDTGGYGLGLAIVRSIATVHGTEVSLREAEGGGTVAVLELPAANSSAVAAKDGQRL
jgi:signal transduction histidine kinase